MYIYKFPPQSLFHIPEFRSVVLQFQPPPLPNSEQSYHHCLLFLVELRRLFALLVATQRKYIDPQRAIQVSTVYMYTSHSLLLCVVCYSVLVLHVVHWYCM